MLYKETVERATFELLKTLMQDEKLKSFNLVGGTALALYLGHRKSIDLDLFSTQVFDEESLKEHLIDKYNFKIDDPSKISKVTLIGSINGVKVDCISYKMGATKGLTYFEDIDFSVPVDMINGKYSWKEIEKRLYDMVEFPEKKFLVSPKLLKK